MAMPQAPIMVSPSRSVIRKAISPFGDIDRADEILGVGAGIGMRNAARVLGNTFVVCERRYCFGVPEARRTQNQPLGLEDGDTSFAQGLGLEFPGRS